MHTRPKKILRLLTTSAHPKREIGVRETSMLTKGTIDDREHCRSSLALYNSEISAHRMNESIPLVQENGTAVTCRSRVRPGYDLESGTTPIC